MPVPHHQLLIDLQQDLEVIQKQIAQFIKESVDSREAKVEQLSGGNTNKLFKIDFADKSILCRINGIGTEHLLDRKKEIEYMNLLSEISQGPTILATFDNGFVYEYLPGRCLQPEELGSHAESIAHRLALFHKVQINASREPVVFQMLSKWFNDIKTFNFNANQRDRVSALNLEKMEQEVKKIQDLAVQYHLDITFCHNDLLAYNILYDQDSLKHYFIDYEYCGYNYRAFDIGNHFCEYTGFTVDPTKYPSVETQRTFIKEYLTTSGTEANEESIEKLRSEANLFSLVAHLFWGTWGVYQAYYSNIDFDYVKYAGEKYAWYWQGREEYLDAFITKHQQ